MSLAAVESALWRAAEELLPARARARPALVSAVIARSRRYTSERGRLAEEPEDPETDLAARALFFTVADAAKIAVPIAELDGRGLVPATGVRILDLGAGAGAMTLGAIALLGDRVASAHLVDRDRAALELARAAAAALAPGARVTTEVAGVTSPAVLERAAGADLVVLGSVLNELPEPERRGALGGVLSALGERGSVIAIEPALRETARDLHHLRDWVLGEELATVFAPCTRTLAPCPALEDERDWCHEDRPIDLPPRAAGLAAATGLRTHGMKFAYLVLRRAGAGLIDVPARRVVSRLQKSKGKRELFACSDEGRVRMRLLNRNRSAANRPFERARRGELLIASATDVGRDDRVEVVDPTARRDG